MSNTERSETKSVSWVVKLVSNSTGTTVCSGYGDTQQEARDDCARNFWVRRRSVNQWETKLQERGIEFGTELTAMRERCYPNSRGHVVTKRYVTANVFTQTITTGRLDE